MYPSIIAENNIAPNTQIGRIEIDEKVYENENVYKYETYSRGGEFTENISTNNHIEFCHRWFGLAGIKELLSDIDAYFESVGLGKFSKLMSIKNGKRAALIPTSNYKRQAIVKDNRKHHSPIIFDRERDISITYDTLIKENT